MCTDRSSASALARALASACLLALAACSSGEASPVAGQPQKGSRLALMRGYQCDRGRVVGQYSCARALDRQRQREASAADGPSCPSCGPAVTR